MRLFSILIVIILMISCEGPKGEDGISDIYTIQFEVFPEEWTGNKDGYTAILNVPEIDNEVFNNGATLLYVLEEDFSPKFYYQIPNTHIKDSLVTYMDVEYETGKAIIYYRQVNGFVNVTKKPDWTFVFKLIIMKGQRISIDLIPKKLNDTPKELIQ